jgi:hypothetical protein
MEENKSIYHLGMVSIEIYKNENKVRYQLMIPLGTKWEDAMSVCDDFKVAIADLEKTAKAQEKERQEQVVHEAEVA